MFRALSMMFTDTKNGEKAGSVMAVSNESRIRIHGAWDGSRSAEVRFGDLEDVHWFQPVGSPQPLLHAFVTCSQILTGDVPHECDGRLPSHRLLVCILKRHITPAVRAELARRADESRGARTPAWSRVRLAPSALSDR
jgi:hypothetical protein